MKQSGMYIFFTIVLIIYFLVNSYIFTRGLQALPRDGYYRQIFVIMMLILIIAYPLGRIFENFLNRAVAEFFIHLGAYYLAIMVFAFFMILLIDIVRLGNVLFHFLPQSWSQPASRINAVLFVSISVIVLGLTIIGALNARFPRIRNLDLILNKSHHSQKQIDIVLATDIHLGTLIHNSRLGNIVHKINNLNPDVILLGGDVFDENIDSLIEQNIASVLANLKAKYGVYAIPGNHEYYSGIDAAVSYMKEAKITVLRDSVVLVAGSFYLVGRDDRTLNQFGGKRKSLEKLMENVDSTYPIILMDHQPFHLEQAENQHIDLQLSGHTHHGQLFPFNLITNRVYELSWGYEKRGSTHYYVSCGVGTWGPPVRLGNRPEIVHIRIQLKGTDEQVN